MDAHTGRQDVLSEFAVSSESRIDTIPAYYIHNSFPLILP